MNECCTIAENVEYCPDLKGWICNRCESYIRYADLPSTHPDSFETRHGSGTKVVDGEAMSECCKDDKLAFVLKRSSWENLFLQLHEHGLAPIHPERIRMLGDKGIFDTTEGNFWAALGELERQFQVQTGDFPKIKFGD